MRAVDYNRVSTDEQAKEGYSIGTQRELNTKFIESQGWDLVDSYIDDGYSAKDLKRPEMQRLINDAKQRKIDVVVFYKLDRLVRSVSDLEKLLTLFDENGIAIRSVTEPFDTTTAMGRFLITLVAAIAQWERQTISERVVVNMAQKATLGERNGGKAPFGYKLVDGKLSINKEEAKYVKEIFNLYLKGHGYRSIAIYLNQIGIKKDIRAIGRIIENPVYCGRLRWGKNSKMDEIITDHEAHPSIVDEETFEKAQEVRLQRTKEGKRATSTYSFSGVLRCARCGSPLSGYYKKARETKHYICVGKKNKGICDLPMFLERNLTTEFLNSFSPDDPDRFFKLIDLDQHPDDTITDNTDEIKEIEKELAAIKKRKRNWLLALGNETISQDEFREMTSEDNKKQEILTKKLEQLSQDAVTIDRDSLIEIIKSVPILWETANDYEKKSFINELFDQIIVDVPSEYYRAPGKTPTVIIKEIKLR